MLALGWRGSAIHWHRYQKAYLLLAGLATPLVVSVHTIVSFDFAISITSRVAHHDFPALLRRGRNLFRIRDGADADHSAAGLVQHAGPDHDAAHRGRVRR